jgi:hypothetical protein
MAENSPTGLGVLASLLDEVWDFDSDIASPKLIASQVLGKPIRAYYQHPVLPSGAPPGSVVIDANAERWVNYVERASGDPAEVPPLPPERTNSNANTGLDGHNVPSRTPPIAPAGGYTHHLIRDFMFLDAAAANSEASGPPPLLQPNVPKQFTVNFLPLDPGDFVSEDSALTEFTRGTGHWTGVKRVKNKHLLDNNGQPLSPSDSSDLAFLQDDLSFSTLLYELADLQNNAVDGGESSPNWFGVAVPEGITDFSNVVIYFHPTPQQAGYMDPDYPSKTNGANPQHTNWKELLGYVDRLGAQLAGAIKHSNATPNQIVIVPLMRNQNLDGGSSVAAGILPRQWYYIVTDILKDLPTRLPTLS